MAGMKARAAMPSRFSSIDCAASSNRAASTSARCAAWATSLRSRTAHKQTQLRKQLLIWLIIPLSLLLSADALVSYWIALSFSQRAYDRSLVEIARDLSLHLREQEGRVELDLPESARRILLTDPEDSVYFEVSTDDGRLLAGDRLPRASRSSARGSRLELLYGAEFAGAPVRVVEMQADRSVLPSPKGAVIRVAETM